MKKLLPLLALLCACATTAPINREADVNRMLDSWHGAAGTANEQAYFGAMSPEFVFLGTDATERWGVDAFRDFAHPYFAKGKAWTFVPRERHVIFAPDGITAWFDEKLDSASYGDCRGTGVVRRVGGEWKIAHYNLTIPIPNDLAGTVVEMVKRRVKGEE